MTVPTRYQSTNPRQALAHVIEECGELLAAAGKTVRWGWDSVNPEIPTDQQETNLDWLMRELDDLDFAISEFRKHINKMEADKPGNGEGGTFRPEKV